MRARRHICAASLAALGAGCLSLTAAAQGADSVSVPEIRVTARQLPPSASEPVYATTILDRGQFEDASEARLDDVLRSVPGFGLFRRQSSRASHPTTQGVTLRGLGPSGAGRTLVLLDGVPQNDPFGGWIDWSRLPVSSLENTIITRGGGAGPWGNTALAGVIRLQSRSDAGTKAWGEVRGDSLPSVDGSVSAQVDAGVAEFFGTAHGHYSNGVFLIRKNQRGAVDVRTANRGGWFQGGTRFVVGDDIQVTATGSYSEDRYVNGIAIAVSKTSIADGSISLVRDGGKDSLSWEAHAYVRDQDFSSVFTAVGAGRRTATPSLDQFSVPAQTYGGNAIVRFPFADTATLEVGADIRYVEGATNEKFTFVGNAFTRLRHAGGNQTITGAFTELNWLPVPGLTITAGGRIDYWQQDDGVRRETVIATGQVLVNNAFADRDGTESNFRFGARSDLTDDLTLRAVAYSGFRIPTLNELYRPFRVGNDITEANAGLRPERLYGVEGGVEWRANEEITMGFTFFHVWLRNAVSNITVTTTPGLEPTLGVFVPAGGVLRQRRNVDRVAADGFEAEILWRPADSLDLALSYLFTSPKIKRNAAQPNLVGLSLAQVARHQATLTATAHPDDRWTFKGELRFASSQYDDDLNSRQLKSYAAVDVYTDFAVTEKVSVFVGAENLFNTVIEAGRSADGLVTVGSPLLLSGGLRLRF